MSAVESPVLTHAEHPVSDMHTLCGKYCTRLTPISVGAEIDCLECLVHMENETKADVDY